MPHGLLSPRPALCAIFLGLAFGAAPAHATSALFDFDDFPVYWEVEGPGWTDPFTDLYGCEGKSYCTAQDVYRASDDNYDLDSVSTTRNGITLEIGRYGATWDINWDQGGRVGIGNDPADFDLFLADFDVPLRRFGVDIAAPRILQEAYCEYGECEPDVYSLFKVYLWSGPGGTGDLVGEVTLTPYDDLGASPGFVDMVSTDAFRSANFGLALSLEADCISGGPVRCGLADGFLWYHQYSIDNIRVSTVPEPSTALLLATGLLGMTARRRRPGR